ncbi:hypothetical protein Pcinc_030212 [Petrolisthes cinctipes]|uniref:Uncharacterized protein n=1 Tax=Petrolisthes cinctipes TaxID=88211 RepID=A0AAE1K6B6_PETCI|nr:hypothetical protein Pcinc_030212 [Petrolisthes cinctipes]
MTVEEEREDEQGRGERREEVERGGEGGKWREEEKERGREGEKKRRREEEKERRRDGEKKRRREEEKERRREGERKRRRGGGDVEKNQCYPFMRFTRRRRRKNTKSKAHSLVVRPFYT